MNFKIAFLATFGYFLLVLHCPQLFQGDGTQEVTNSGAEQDLYDPMATPDVDK